MTDTAPSLPTLIDSIVASVEMGLDSTDGHTPLDYAHLMVAGVPPTATQPRERAVPCWRCGAETFNQHGACDRHYERPEIVDRMELMSAPALISKAER